MNKLPEQVSADLDKIVRGDVFADIIHRAAYSTDASIYRIIPICVVAPRDAADVVATVKYARGEGLPIVARGGGSGLAGEALCSGIVLDMTRYMNRVLSIDETGRSVVCEPGLGRVLFYDRLAQYRRKIGPDPSSANRATIGGCVANNSTGAHWLEYGYIGDYVDAVEAVLSDGTLVTFTNNVDPAKADDKKAGSLAAQCAGLIAENEIAIKKAQPRTRRNRCGYNIAGVYHDGRIDMAKLMAGSEGTLAVFTKITLRTVPVPAAKGLLQLEFDSLCEMAQAVPIVVESGVSACEMIDKNLIDMAIESLPEYRDILPVGVAAVLLAECTGDSLEQVRAKIDKTDAAAGKMASGRRIVLDRAEQARIWKSRKDAGPLLFRRKSKKHPAEFMEDVSVDYHRLGEYLAGLERIAKKYDIFMAYFGHAGDGELHIRPNLDLGDPADREKMRKMADEVFDLAWSLGGTISGEHATGLVRAPFVRKQYGDDYYRIICKIKNIFDPGPADSGMNPGKIINPDSEVMFKNLRAERQVLPERTKTDLLFGEQELALELQQCYGCGLCRTTEPDLRMCPVFRAMGEELGSPRAKANLLAFWATGQLRQEDFESAEFRKFLDLCINCKACTRQCPAGADIPGLVTVARAEYVRRKGLRRAERMLSGNRFLGALGSILGPPANFFMGLGVFKWMLDKFAGIDKRRRMPLFARGSFFKVGRRYLTACEPIAEPIDKVAYFVDTYANYNDHGLGFAVVDVLRANGIDVILPRQLPAPLPAITYGDVKRAKKDLAYSVKHLAKAIRDGYKVVCSEPSAALCLKDELKRYVTGPDAELVAENTFELMSYLLNLHEQGKLKAPRKTISQKYVYHLPCHLCVAGQEGASIRLIEELCKAEVIDLKAGCCGLAGTYGMQKKNYELSEKIAENLKAALESSPTKNVLTECAACGMQIEHISDCVVRHPIKVLAEAYSE